MGATDDFGYKSVDNIVSVYDLHATYLQALGFDHRKLTYPHERFATTASRTPSSTDARPVPELLS